MQDFLSTTKYIDYKDEAIQMKIREFFSDNMDDVEKTKIVYHFMQEEISHSFDCNATVVTAKASDVLKNRTGICHAKANLFAALLRSQNIPEQANGLQDVVKNIPEFVLEEPDIKETGKSGVLDIDARSVNKEFRERLNYNYELQH